MRSRLSPRALGLTLDAVNLAVFCAFLVPVRQFVTDDAYITLRHAERLALGDGFVWNAGGPRCEGFSNPLFFAIEALATWVGFDGMQAARVVSILCSFALLVTMRRMGSLVVGERAAAAAAFLMAASAPFAFWTVSGLETAMVVLVVTAGTLVLGRPDGGSAWRAGWIFALLPWLRPEGPVPALALAFASEAFGILDPTRRRASLTRLAQIAGPVIVSSAVLEAARWGIYGHLLPNSAVLKMANAEIGEVTLPFLIQLAPAGALAFAGALLLRGRSRLIIIPAFVWLVGSLRAWNNVNDFGRFLLPTVPAWLLVAAFGLDAAAAFAERRRALVVAIATATLALAFAVWPTVSSRKVADFAQTYVRCRAVVRANAGFWLAEHAPPGSVYAMVDAGLIPYNAGGTALDTIALNDPRIQETGALSWEDRADLVMGDHPDFILLASDSGAAEDARYAIDQAVVAHPDFAAYYRPEAHIRTDDCMYHLPIYRRIAGGSP